MEVNKMPKSVLYNANLAASTKTANIFAGDVNEFIPYDAVVRITSVSSAIGVRMSVFADSDLLVDDKEIPFIGTSLIDKDHVIDEFEVEAGTRIAIFLRETAAAGTTDVYTGLEVTPT
jgi:hypothetical protein